MESFARLAETGKVLPKDLPGHEDGWGIGWYPDGRCSVYKSAATPLQEKVHFLKIIKRADGSPVLVAHLRKSAWPGTRTADNSHPFRRGNYIFAHNGTIRDYKSILSFMATRGRPGSKALDTEVFFSFIMSFMHMGVAGALRLSIRHICANNSYSSLNCLLSDGINVYAYREYRANPEYYSLYRAFSGKSNIISSERLSSDLQWKMIKPGKLLIL